MYDELLKFLDISDKNKSILYSNKSAAFYELYINENNPKYLYDSKKNAKCSINYCPEYFKGYYRLAKIYENK